MDLSPLCLFSLELKQNNDILDVAMNKIDEIPTEIGYMTALTSLYGFHVVLDYQAILQGYGG